MRALFVTAAFVAASAKRIEIDWVVDLDNEPMQRITASAGDTLVFDWEGPHNVYLADSCDGAGANAWNDYTCPTENWGTNLGESSPVEYVIPGSAQTGDYLCFACEVGGEWSHCSFGQHTTVYINNETPKVIDLNWIVKGNNEKMQKVTAAAGDVLRFSWKGRHNVYKAMACPENNAWDNYDCPEDDEWGYLYGEETDVDYVISELAQDGDKICFACEVGSHCQGGQHTTVTIKNPTVHEIDWRLGNPNDGSMASMQYIEVKPREKLKFVWTGYHNVYLLPSCDGEGAHKWDAFTCPAATEEYGYYMGDASPVVYTVPADTEEGSFLCFACEVSGHCSGGGQHTTVKIVTGFGQLKKICEDVTQEDRCGFCKGSLEDGKCKVNVGKLRTKFSCKKIQADNVFCEQVGCYVKKNGKCDGESEFLQD